MREVQSQRELRGIPLVGGRRSSAIPNSEPLKSLLDKESRGRLKPKRDLDPIPRASEPLLLIPERKGRPLARAGVISAGRFFVGT